MITIKSTSYRSSDAVFLADVINSGLNTCCANYSEYYIPNNKICEGCAHKTACVDLQSAYHYMIGKALRMFSEENVGKIDPLELELLDS